MLLKRRWNSKSAFIQKIRIIRTFPEIKHFSTFESWINSVKFVIRWSKKFLDIIIHYHKFNSQILHLSLDNWVNYMVCFVNTFLINISKILPSGKIVLIRHKNRKWPMKWLNSREVTNEIAGSLYFWRINTILWLGRIFHIQRIAHLESIWLG